MRLAIRYATRFLYAGPVWQSHNVLRACPVADERQRVLEYHVTTTPPSRVFSYVDYWGTRVDSFGVRRAHPRLEIVAEMLVETEAPTLPAWAAVLGCSEGMFEARVTRAAPDVARAGRRAAPALDRRARHCCCDEASSRMRTTTSSWCSASP